MSPSLLLCRPHLVLTAAPRDCGATTSSERPNMRGIRTRSLALEALLLAALIAITGVTAAASASPTQRRTSRCPSARARAPRPGQTP